MLGFSALLFGISPIQKCDFLWPMFDQFFLDIKKTKIQKKKGILHVLAWLKMIIKKNHQTPKQSL